MKLDEDQSEEARGTATAAEEFKTPTDFQDQGQFPEQGQHSEFNIEFFEFHMIYPLGPCTFHMGK